MTRSRPDQLQDIILAMDMLKYPCFCIGGPLECGLSICGLWSVGAAVGKGQTESLGVSRESLWCRQGSGSFSNEYGTMGVE